MASEQTPATPRVTADRERFGALLYAERWRQRLSLRAASVFVAARAPTQGLSRLRAWESGQQLPTATELSRYLAGLGAALETQELLGTWLRLAVGVDGGPPESAAPVLVELVRPVLAQEGAPETVAARVAQALLGWAVSAVPERGRAEPSWKEMLGSVAKRFRERRLTEEPAAEKTRQQGAAAPSKPTGSGS